MLTPSFNCLIQRIIGAALRSIPRVGQAGAVEVRADLVLGYRTRPRRRRIRIRSAGRATIEISRSTFACPNETTSWMSSTNLRSNSTKTRHLKKRRKVCLKRSPRQPRFPKNQKRTQSQRMEARIQKMGATNSKVHSCWSRSPAIE